ncbi:uncharacterized protein TA07455 [Theileria annulata]|uniref:Uncharacterized protein n=1 Tax=Theileria annulata TaxID=5874 RepID=Q4UA56_THEAN|nr:uncharacterized protein TA07455 [Theileria annulata]CAI76297.1 hypothetical protein TA07455 [Theileria annulata]|eukprot:XP_952921.1 hypothetical protein TA07455 [Theileria annulata]
MLILVKIGLLLLFFGIIGIFGKNTEFTLDDTELSEKLSLRILKQGNLTSEPIKKGSKIQLKIKSFSPQLNQQITGEVTQTFIVGEHNIKPLNEALLDMRIGEIRRLGVPIASYGKIFYEFSLLKTITHQEL